SNDKLMSTEQYLIDKDIAALCVTASTFPEGVQNAHKKLHSLFPASERRTFYGISYADKTGSIIYKAATEQLHEGEARQLNLETFTIRKGKYINDHLTDGRIDETYKV